MEITHHPSPKRLHHHALPIVIVAIAILIVSTPLALHQNTLTGNGTALAHDLTTRPLHVTPTSNGFAHITLNENSNEHISPEVSQAGRSAELTFNLDR